MVQPYRARWRKTNAKTALEFLADLQHEFWFPRHSVWLGSTARQHERDLQLSRSKGIRYSFTLACWASHRIDRATHYRRDERPHMELARQTTPLFSGRCDPFKHSPFLHARFNWRENGSWVALGSGRKHQYQHGAFPRVCRGQAEHRTANSRLRHAELLHWYWCVTGKCTAAYLPIHGCDRQDCEWYSPHVAILFQDWGSRLPDSSSLDHLYHERIS